MLEHVDTRPAPLLRFARHRDALCGQRRNLDESIEELRDIADGRNDIWPKLQGSPLALGTPGLPHMS